MSDQQVTATVVSKKTGVLEESPGVKSSKRLFGALLIGAGGLLLAAIGVVAIFRSIADPETALAAGKALIITGAALLGVGVFEGITEAVAKRRTAADVGYQGGGQ